MRFRYGSSPGQEADLHLPDVARPPVVCLLHGGFWRMPYDREQFTPVATDLARCGFAVWNMEYRRLGGAGSGWPGTMDDVVTGIEYLAQVADRGIELDLGRVATVGHSAGGHLALYAAGRGPGRVRIVAAAGLAPIADLAQAHRHGLGGDAVGQLMGGPPSLHPGRYQAASPAEMLPLNVTQLILHGAADEVVPVQLSHRYAQAARASGDEVEMVELPGTGHMEFLDPASEAHVLLRRWLQHRLR